MKQRGTAAAVSKYLQSSPFASKPLTPQAISMFIHGTRGLDIDSLEDLAVALNLKGGIPELLDVPNQTGLSGDEQRLVLAYRVLPEAVQGHLLSLAEQGSVAVRQLDKYARQRRTQLHGNRGDRTTADLPVSTAASITQPESPSHGRASPGRDVAAAQMAREDFAPILDRPVASPAGRKKNRGART